MSDTKDSVPVILAKRLKYNSSHEMDEFDEQGVGAPTVPHKYRGTVTDKRDMQMLGKAQVLRVSADTSCVVDRRSLSNVLL